MALTVHKIALVSVFLALLSHGLRTAQDFSRKSLANALLAINPTAAFVPSSSIPHAAGLNRATRTKVPVMMPKFLKNLFPDLEKPEDAGKALADAFSSLLPKEEPLPVVEIDEPSGALVGAGKGMSALAPIFSVEADLQAALTNLGSYDEDEVQAEIAETIASAPVVVYTYGLSPFSTEVIKVLESTGCKYKNVELGGEWFLLGGKGSATRVELRKLYGQGSLPHIFIGGEWIGGLTTGGDGGLMGLIEREELVPMLRKAKAL